MRKDPKLKEGKPRVGENAHAKVVGVEDVSSPTTRRDQDGELPKQRFNRVVLELPEALVDRIDHDLMPAIGYKTRSVFISSAIEFYIWAIQEVINGAAVGAMTHDEDEGTVFRTNETAGLQNLKRWLDKRATARAVGNSSSNPRRSSAPSRQPSKP